MAVNISNIDSYLEKFLENKNHRNKIEVCEAILEQRSVKGLTDYSKELLALALEKKIVIAIEQHYLNKQKPSFWRDTKLIAPMTYQENNFLKIYINLFLREFNKSNGYVDKGVNEIENFYDEIIYKASKSFRNQVFVLPNCERASVGDLQMALYNAINIPVNRTIKIKKKTGTLKEVAAIAGLTTILAANMVNQQKEVVVDEIIQQTKFTENVVNKQIRNEVITDTTIKTQNKKSFDNNTGTKVIPQVSKEISFVGYEGNCPIEYQEYMYEMCEKYDIPFNLLITIVDNESDGLFTSNGIISDTDDYGLCQINICNHDGIFEKFGYVSDDLLNDPYKNIEAASYLISEICKMYPQDFDNGNYENIFGTYNGWVLWKHKEDSLNYVANATMKMNTIYNKTNEELFGITYEVDNEKTR